MRNHVFSALLALGAGACGTSSSASARPDDTTKFVGTWAYQTGSSVLEDCPGTPERTIDLSRVLGGQPGFFTMTPASGGVHEVDARGCQYDWKVAGDVATAAAGQACANFPDGRGGALQVRLVSGAKSTGDGASMSVDVRFATDPPSSCSIHVQGTTKKS